MKDKPSPIEKEWTTTYGLQCKVVFTHMSFRCGYVKLPEAFRAVDYDSLPVDVHGGLTYGPDKEGFVGFDCAHAGDADADNPNRFPHYHFWTLEEVVEETEKLAEQLNKLTWRAIFDYKLRYEPEWFKQRITFKEIEP